MAHPAPFSSATADRGPPVEALAGFVERVTFHNAETGFCVLRVKARLCNAAAQDSVSPDCNSCEVK